MNKFFRHWGLLNRHRYHVFLNGCHCGIGFHCLFHDLSKYGPKEFFPSVKNYTGVYSPVAEERSKNDLFSFICQHHTKRNKHHWEYWTDFYRGSVIAINMPWLYAVEYVCDMLSASYCYDPEGFIRPGPYYRFLEHKTRYYLTDATDEFVTWCLKRFAELGWDGLKKKDTKKMYAEIAAKYPRVKVFPSPLGAGTLPEGE